MTPQTLANQESQPMHDTDISVHDQKMFAIALAGIRYAQRVCDRHGLNLADMMPDVCGEAGITGIDAADFDRCAEWLNYHAAPADEIAEDLCASGHTV